MKIPKIIKNNETEILYDEVNVQNIDYSDILELAYGSGSDYYGEILDDPKKKDRFIKNIVSTVRSTKEMRTYIGYLKEELKMNECTILNGVDMTNAGIELHHYPFSLYEITRIILDYHLINKIKFSSISLVSVIAESHFLGMIGLVPLSTTIHELVHTGDITVSLKSAFGNWKEFVKKYINAMTEDDVEHLKVLIRRSSDVSFQDHNKIVTSISRTFIGMQEDGDETAVFPLLDHFSKTETNTDNS